MALKSLLLQHTKSSMSLTGLSSEAKDLKASRMGLYPVHLQRFPSKASSTSSLLNAFPFLLSIKLMKKAKYWSKRNSVQASFSTCSSAWPFLDCKIHTGFHWTLQASPGLDGCSFHSLGPQLWWFPSHCNWKQVPNTSEKINIYKFITIYNNKKLTELTLMVTLAPDVGSGILAVTVQIPQSPALQ